MTRINALLLIVLFYNTDVMADTLTIPAENASGRYSNNLHLEGDAVFTLFALHKNANLSDKRYLQFPSVALSVSPNMQLGSNTLPPYFHPVNHTRSSNEKDKKPNIWHPTWHKQNIKNTLMVTLTGDRQFNIRLKNPLTQNTIRPGELDDELAEYE